MNCVRRSFSLGLKRKDRRIMVLKETITYYVNNGSTDYCSTLDATKAFDRVEY